MGSPGECNYEYPFFLEESITHNNHSVVRVKEAQARVGHLGKVGSNVPMYYDSDICIQLHCF